MELKTQQQVLAYLKDQGYQLEKSSLSDHVRQGKLAKKNGVFPGKAVDSYAKANLVRADTGKKDDGVTEHLNEQKLRAELRIKNAQARTAEIELAKVEGKVIDREDVERQQAGRAVVIDRSLASWIRGKVPEWIARCQGNQATAGELIASMLADKDIMMNAFSQPLEFEIDCHPAAGGDLELTVDA